MEEFLAETLEVSTSKATQQLEELMTHWDDKEIGLMDVCDEKEINGALLVFRQEADYVSVAALISRLITYRVEYSVRWGAELRRDADENDSKLYPFVCNNVGLP